MKGNQKRKKHPFAVFCILLLAASAGITAWLGPHAVLGYLRGGWEQVIAFYLHLQEEQQLAVTRRKITTITLTNDDLHQGNLILVNSAYACPNPPKESLIDLSEFVNGYYRVRDPGTLINRDAADPLCRMLYAFEQNRGFDNVAVVNAYRTKEHQTRIYNEKVRQVGKKEAAKWVAKPGYSEHQSGYAVDFGITGKGGKITNYTGTGEYQWLSKNAHIYGYIVRYRPEKKSITGIADEPWHFRYVGRPHADYISEHNLSLEEYIDQLKAHGYGKPLTIENEKGVYEVYYVKATGDKTSVTVPKWQSYTISGNNADGFIITVKKESKEEKK